MGANQNSIGIEHVGSETDLLNPPQAAATMGAGSLPWLQSLAFCSMASNRVANTLVNLVIAFFFSRS
jgi:hypothetical protein